MQQLDVLQKTYHVKRLVKYFDGSYSLWMRIIHFKYKIANSIWDLYKTRDSS